MRDFSPEVNQLLVDDGGWAVHGQSSWTSREADSDETTTTFADEMS